MNGKKIRDSENTNWDGELDIISDYKHQVNECLELLNDGTIEQMLAEDIKNVKIKLTIFSYNIHHFFSTIYWVSIWLLLTTIVVQTGFKTKTQLQRLSEGDIVQNTPVKTKPKKNKNKTETTNKKPAPKKNQAKQTKN